MEDAFDVTDDTFDEYDFDSALELYESATALESSPEQSSSQTVADQKQEATTQSSSDGEESDRDADYYVDSNQSDDNKKM